MLYNPSIVFDKLKYKKPYDPLPPEVVGQKRNRAGNVENAKIYVPGKTILKVLPNLEAKLKLVKREQDAVEVLFNLKKMDR